MLEAYTNKSDANVYIKAAKSLGLDVNILSARNGTVIISDNNKSVYFKNTSPSFNNLAAHGIARDKYLTNRILKRQNIPTPRSRIFRLDEVKDVIEYAQKNFPVVIKPNNEGQGKGVFVNIKDSLELTIALSEIIKMESTNILVEEYILGKDYRILVYKGEILDVIQRLPAFIIGNGKSSVDELIEEKNEERKRILGDYPIKRDTMLFKKLKEADLKITDVVEKGRRVELRDNCNYSTGGETHRIDKNSIPEENKELFIKVQKISNLDLCGVDFISKNITVPYSKTRSVINEVNSSNGVDIHYFADMEENLLPVKRILQKYFGIE